MRPRSLLAGLLSVALAAACTAPAPTAATISGTVRDASGPVEGATVRVQGTQNETVTDAEGRFTLRGVEPGTAITVSAWKGGYYCAKVDEITPPADGVALTLRRYQTNDNPDYEWILPIAPAATVTSCNSCKPGVTQVWLENDAHAGSARNVRFLTLYTGTDVTGNQSPPTRYTTDRDYGSIPLRPDPSLPYYGPGYRLDFPDSAGNCAACHVPGAAVDAPYATDPTSVTGADEYGIHCDFCHKIADVRLDPATGLPYPNRPGVLSMDVRRPFPEDEDRYQLFFGTFDDDNVPEEDTYLPLIEQSQFCAPCHYGLFWDTVVYNSFGEWLASPYSDPETGQTCQQCHMPAPTLLDGEPITNVAPGLGGVERDPATLHAHTFPGAASEDLLRSAVTLAVEAQRDGSTVEVVVTITNDLTGHHVPTDSPLRHLILLVRVTDADGRVLDQIGGPTVPEWGGIGDPEEGYYAGLPGTAYAKVLQEMWTEVAPTGAYWNMTRVLSDNRIPALGSDTTRYTFEESGAGEVSVEVTLWFRRAYRALMDQKGWDVPDIMMEQAALSVP